MRTRPRSGVRLPRWRCDCPGCPLERRWQRVTEWGEYDPMDVALGELEAHYARVHGDNDGRAAA